MTRPLIPNVTRASDIRRCIRYDLIGRDGRNPRPFAQLIASSLPTTDPELIAQAMEKTFRRHKRIQKPIHRFSLSVPSGVKLTNYEWEMIARMFLRGMGLADLYDFYLVLHEDTEHFHCHLCVSRIPISGSSGPRGGSGAWSPYRDFRRSHQVCERISEALQLGTLVEAHSLPLSPSRDLSEALRVLLESILSKPVDLQTFFSILRENNVNPEPAIAITGRISGLAYRISGNNKRIKGSTVGFPWSKVQHLVEFDPDRDMPVLLEAKHQGGPHPDSSTTKEETAHGELVLEELVDTRTHVAGQRDLAGSWTGHVEPRRTLVEGDNAKLGNGVFKSSPGCPEGSELAPKTWGHEFSEIAAWSATGGPGQGFGPPFAGGLAGCIETAPPAPNTLGELSCPGIDLRGSSLLSPSSPIPSRLGKPVPCDNWRTEGLPSCSSRTGIGSRWVIQESANALLSADPDGDSDGNEAATAPPYVHTSPLYDTANTDQRSSESWTSPFDGSRRLGAPSFPDIRLGVSRPGGRAAWRAIPVDRERGRLGQLASDHPGIRRSKAGI